MQRLLRWGLFQGVFLWTPSLLAEPLVEGYLDDGDIRIHWQVFEPADVENPRPVAGEFTYLYWLEPNGESSKVFGFDLYRTFSNTSTVIGTTGPLSTTGVITGTGAEPIVTRPGAWRFGDFSGLPGVDLAAGERTAAMFVNSRSAPDDVLSNIFEPQQVFCFGCERINAIPGPAYVATPGDYDSNGTVELADYTIWKAHYGETFLVSQGSRHRADGNADGVVNTADYTLWRNNYTLLVDGSAIPEPAMSTLLAVLLICSSALRAPVAHRNLIIVQSRMV